MKTLTQSQIVTVTAPPESTLLARAYRLILSWGCPKCGKPYPCPCDIGAAKGSAPKDLLIGDTEAPLAAIQLPREMIARNHGAGITNTGNLLATDVANTTARR